MYTVVEYCNTRAPPEYNFDLAYIMHMHSWVHQFFFSLVPIACGYCRPSGKSTLNNFYQWGKFIACTFSDTHFTRQG